MSDFEGPTRRGEVDTTRATARLPDLDIEIVHRRSPGGDAEQLSINLEAVPLVRGVRLLCRECLSIRVLGAGGETDMAPWLVAAQAVMPPSLRLPQMDAQAISRSADDSTANRSS